MVFELLNLYGSRKSVWSSWMSCESRDETRFQAAEFDWKIIRFIWFLSVFSMLHFGLYFGHTYSDDYRKDVDYAVNFWLEYSRLVHACILLNWCVLMCALKIWPFVKKLVFKYGRGCLWYVTGIYCMTSNCIFLAVLDAELPSLQIEPCAPEFENAYCPNASWGVIGMSWRVSLIYVTNRFWGIPFKYLVPVNLIHLVFLATIASPWGPFEDYLWTNKGFGWSIIFSLVQCVVHTVLSLTLCNQSENERRQTFNNIRQTELCKKTTQVILGTMLPERLISGGVGNIPYLLTEEYPMVTVMFCQFGKTDILNFVSASHFLQHVAEKIAVFDRLVSASGMFKVEHIGEDYVVASPVLKTGPLGALENAQSYKWAAMKVVKLAAMLVEAGNGTKESSKLNFKAGVHSGPLIAAVAGQTRRFFRLFGDTVNTAARMCHHSSVGQVQISDDTKLLLEGMHSLCLTENEHLKVKGKGLMRTFSFSAKAKAKHDYSQSFNKVLSPQHVQESDMEPCAAFETQEDDTVDTIEVERRESVVERAMESVLQVIRGSIGSLMMRESQRPSLRYYQSMGADGRTHWFRGKFLDKRLEAEFRKWQQESSMHGTRQYLVTMLVGHTCFFTSLYSVVDFTSLVEIISVGVVGVALIALHLGMLKYLHLAGQVRRQVYINVSIIASTVGMVYTTAICTSPFVTLGLVLLIIARPSNELPLRTLSYVLFCFFSAAVVLVAVQNLDYDQVYYRLHASTVVIWLILANQVSLSRSMRATWFRQQEFSTENERMDDVLNDLIPNPSAQEFVRSRYLQMLEGQSHTEAVRDSVLEVEAFSRTLMFMDDSSPAVILCTDLVGFTPLCQALHPKEVVRLLHDLWCIMDQTISQHAESYDDQLLGTNKLYAPHMRPFKVETIGDAYIVVSKFQTTDYSAEQMAAYGMLKLASVMMKGIHRYNLVQGPACLGIEPGMVNMRMGMDMGQAICGVIGYLQARYHVYGEVLRNATKCESSSSQGCITVSDSVTSTFHEMGGQSTFSLIDDGSSLYPFLEIVSTSNRSRQDLDIGGNLEKVQVSKGKSSIDFNMSRVKLFLPGDQLCHNNIGNKVEVADDLDCLNL